MNMFVFHSTAIFFVWSVIYLRYELDTPILKGEKNSLIFTFVLILELGVIKAIV